MVHSIFLLLLVTVAGDTVTETVGYQGEIRVRAKKSCSTWNWAMASAPPPEISSMETKTWSWHLFYVGSVQEIDLQTQTPDLRKSNKFICHQCNKRDSSKKYGSSPDYNSMPFIVETHGRTGTIWIFFKNFSFLRKIQSLRCISNAVCMYSYVCMSVLEHSEIYWLHWISAEISGVDDGKFLAKSVGSAEHNW